MNVLVVEDEEILAKLLIGKLELDFRTRQVSWQGQAIDLSDREFALLELLALSPGRVFNATELLELSQGLSQVAKLFASFTTLD